MKTEIQNLRKILSIISLLCLSAVTAFAVEVKVENTTECNKVKVSWTGAPSSMSNSRKIEIKSKGVYDYIGYHMEFTIPCGNKTVTVKPDVFPNQLICNFYDGNNLVTADTVIFNDFAYTRSLNLQYDFCEKKLFIEGDFNKDIKGMEGAIPQEYVRYIITNTSTNMSDTLFAPGNDATVVSGYFTKMTFDKNATYVCQASVTDKDKNVYSECTNYSETFEKVDDTYSLSTPIVAVSGDTAISVKFNSQNACSAVTVNLYRCSDNAEIKITDFNYADAHGVYLDKDVDACKLYYYILKAENIGQISDPSEKIAISNDPTPLEISNFEVTKG
ncbi:MAG: hypothetical protein EOM76_11230, partial [Sphingobacteriia bacterium]|nr:hypothetical protein [Sphingobacteriia bacterium]